MPVHPAAGPWAQMIEFDSTADYPDSNGWALGGAGTRSISSGDLRLQDTSGNYVYFHRASLLTAAGSATIEGRVRVVANSVLAGVYLGLYDGARSTFLSLSPTAATMSTGAALAIDMTVDRVVTLVKVGSIFFGYVDGILVGSATGGTDTINSVEWGAGSTSAVTDAYWSWLRYSPNQAIFPLAPTGANALLQQTVQDAPLHYWPLNEAAAPYKDYGSSPVDATVVSAPVPRSRKWPPADAVADFIGTSALSVGTWNLPAAWAVSMWLDFDDDGFILTKDSVGSRGWVMGISGANHFYLESGGAAFWSATDYVFSGPVKCHLVCTFSGTAYNLFKDSVLISTLVSSTNIAGGTGPNEIGRRNYTGAHSYFNGGIGHLAVFPSALSTARIKAHYEAGIRSGLVLG